MSAPGTNLVASGNKLLVNLFALEQQHFCSRVFHTTDSLELKYVSRPDSPLYSEKSFLDKGWVTKGHLYLYYTGQEKQYFTKALLIYDGIHYDPLVCQSNSEEITMFSVDDEEIATLALNMAREAQQVTVSVQWNSAVIQHSYCCD